MYKVMIRDNMSPIAKEILEASGNIEVVVDFNKETNDPAQLAKIIHDYDGLAIRSGTKVTPEVLEKAARLKVIGRAGIGVDNIDVAAATRHGVVVMNAPGGNTITTGEHAIALMLSLARNIPQATASLRSGKWEKKQLTGAEITGKTLGIIGLGAIGRVVAERAGGLKMKVLATDPFVSEKAAGSLGVPLVTLDELLAQADIITLHVPKMKDTANMINVGTLAKMKPGVMIVNCARGELINLNDLYAALESGQVAGAALDVFPVEPPGGDLPILNHPHVIATPHLGASTSEAQDKVAAMIAHQMAEYLNSTIIAHAVNFPSVSKEVMDRLRPYIQLAEKMGALMGQISKKSHDITISYSGEMADLETRPLSHAALKGLLEAFTDKPVNYISAPALAEERGIHVKETLSQEKADFSGLIRINLCGPTDGLDEIWGAVFDRQYPRIVRLGKIYMDAIPEGAMIIIQNHDQPGVIGNVGTLLGKHQINIGRFQLGRRDGRALCMVNIDSPAEETVIEELMALPSIITVRQVQLH